MLLLPVKLEQFELESHARDLLDIPRVVALEPPRVIRRRRLLGDDIPAVRAARRLRFPGKPRLVVLYDVHQYHLARALGAQHDAEVWYVRRPGDPEGAGQEAEDLRLLDQMARDVAVGIVVPGEGQNVRADNEPIRVRLVELEIISSRPFVPEGTRLRGRR